MAQITLRSFEKQVTGKHVPRCQTSACTRQDPSAIRAPFVWADEVLPADISCERSEYRIVVPLSGIDPRNIYVFANPRSLVVEIRLKSEIHHESGKGPVAETSERRISREFALPTEIEERATIVRVCGECLQIIAREALGEHSTSWSELIQFDTRRSVGSVG